jgi:hypothetical protein
MRMTVTPNIVHGTIYAAMMSLLLPEDGMVGDDEAEDVVVKVVVAEDVVLVVEAGAVII